MEKARKAHEEFMAERQRAIQEFVRSE